MAYPSPAACAPLVALVLVLAPDARADFGPARVLVSSQNDYRDVAVADLDLDGDLDVLSASRLANEVAWFENLGGGALGPKQVLSSAVAGAASVFPADVDGDGDVDVLAAAPLADEVVWLENLGGGAFAFGGAVTDATPGAASVHAADLDGDGDLDVLVASPDDGGVGWVVNRGGGSFGPRRALATGLVDARSVTAADLDGDGDAEALVASRDALTWFENTRAPRAFASSCAPRQIPSVGSWARTAVRSHSTSVARCGCSLVWSTFIGPPMTTSPANRLPSVRRISCTP